MCQTFIMVIVTRVSIEISIDVIFIMLFLEISDIYRQTLNKVILRTSRTAISSTFLSGPLKQNLRLTH